MHTKFRNGATAEDLSLFILDPAFPCVGAKSVTSRDTLSTIEAGAFGCPRNTRLIHAGLQKLGDLMREDKGPLRSFACTFDRVATWSEIDFEQALWRHLSWLQEEDVRRGIPWAKECSANPRSEGFGMSIAGHSYFIIGLHPGASRKSRRFGRPAIIFNSQAQFASLRADGRYSAMQSVIRERDIALDGTINPMLGDHGQAPQASQFSGRLVGDDWQCPFSAVVVDD